MTGGCNGWSRNRRFGNVRVWLRRNFSEPCIRSPAVHRPPLSDFPVTLPQASALPKVFLPSAACKVEAGADADNHGPLASQHRPGGLESCGVVQAGPVGGPMLAKYSCNSACHVQYLFRYNAIANSFKRPLTIFAPDPNMWCMLCVSPQN